jgi:hypothetical protein
MEPCIITWWTADFYTALNCQYRKTNEMHFLYSIYYELTTSTCFEHYLLNFRRRCTNKNWYIVCVLCMLASTRTGVPLHILAAAPAEDEQVVLETCRGR